MWFHCKNLLWQSWLALVSALGTTTLAIIVGIVGFFFVLVLNLIFKLRKDGWSWSVTKSHFSQNLRDSFIPTVIGTVILWCVLYGFFVVRTIYKDHVDFVTQNQQLRKKESHLVGLKSCDDEIVDLKKQLNDAKHHSGTKPSVPLIPSPIAPRILTDLQMTVLRRELTAGVGLRVRINVIGKSGDTIDFANELRKLFEGWEIDGGNIGMTNAEISSGLEFEIPNPEERSVQIAAHAFDRARIPYSKNISSNAYRGPVSLGPPPALTINVGDQ